MKIFKVVIFVLLWSGCIFFVYCSSNTEDVNSILNDSIKENEMEEEKEIVSNKGLKNDSNKEFVSKEERENKIKEQYEEILKELEKLNNDRKLSSVENEIKSKDNKSSVVDEQMEVKKYKEDVKEEPKLLDKYLKNQDPYEFKEGEVYDEKSVLGESVKKELEWRKQYIDDSKRYGSTEFYDNPTKVFPNNFLDGELLEKENEVYICNNESNKVYHKKRLCERFGCNSLVSTISEEEAKNRGYKPCKRCVR